MSPILVDMKKSGIGGALPDGVLRLTEVEQTLEDACHGWLVQDDDEFKPIALDPNIWELKFQFGGLPFRLYFGEPPLAPGYLVGLHFHFKETGGSATEITDRQNMEILVAIQRYREAEQNSWSILQGSHDCRLPIRNGTS